MLRLARMELHNALLFNLEAVLRAFVHKRLLEVFALNHRILAIGEHLLRDHVLVHLLRLDHLLVSLEMVLSLSEIAPLQEWILQVLRGVRSPG